MARRREPTDTTRIRGMVVYLTTKRIEPDPLRAASARARQALRRRTGRGRRAVPPGSER